MMKTEITRPTIQLQVSCGMVRKAQLKEALNASNWEFNKAVEHLCQEDQAFKERYEPYLKAWSIPEWMAVRLVECVCPGYEIVVGF